MERQTQRNQAFPSVVHHDLSRRADLDSTSVLQHRGATFLPMHLPVAEVRRAFEAPFLAKSSLTEKIQLDLQTSSSMGQKGLRKSISLLAVLIHHSGEGGEGWNTSTIYFSQ